jgi:predicted nucleic acid-binding protein
MNAVLLDTDVFSFLIKPKDPRAEVYRPHVTGKTVAISFITVGDLYYGAEKKKWSGKTLRNFQERLKAVVVVPYDEELCRTYGKPESIPASRARRCAKRSLDRLMRDPSSDSAHLQQPKTFREDSGSDSD